MQLNIETIVSTINPYYITTSIPPVVLSPELLSSSLKILPSTGSEEGQSLVDYTKIKGLCGIFVNMINQLHPIFWLV